MVSRQVGRSPGAMASEMRDAKELALGKETGGSVGVQPCLNASAVLGLRLILHDRSFQSEIADMIKGEQMVLILYFRMYLSPVLFFFATPSPRLQRRKY